MSYRFTALLLGLILVAGCLPLAAQTYTLQRFDIPYAPNANTYAMGINNRGAIVGSFVGPSSPIRGFKRDANGVFERPIDDPNAGLSPNTLPGGINDFGVISGWYLGSSSSNYSGFLRYKGVFTDFNVLPGTDTYIYGINSNGDFVGIFNDVNGVLHGFVSSNGAVTLVDHPRAVATRPIGIGADGTIVGLYYQTYSQGALGFIRGPAGHYKDIQIPGARETNVNGVNCAAHKIVGTYLTGRHWRGFVYDYITQVITLVDWPDPNTVNTEITGINSHGVIVGFAVTSQPYSHYFSFIGTPQ